MRIVEEHWRKNHGPSWVESYRASVYNPNRLALATALASVAPFGTVLDMGCNCGVLMPLILSASPDAQVTGIDVNRESLSVAKRQWQKHLWVHWSIVDWLPMMEPYRRYDVITSSATLEHITPRDIDSVLFSIARLATKAIVLQEVVTTTLNPNERQTPCGVAEWCYDYPTRLAWLGWHLQFRVWQELTTDRPAAVMVFTKETTR